MTLDTQTATLVAAAIAAIASLSNTIITAWRQSHLEERKWRRARQDELDKWQQQRQDDADAALRTAIANLGQQLANCVQTISWFTWKAEKAPDTLTAEEIEKYNTDMKALLPPLVGAHLIVVALDPSQDASIKPLVETMYTLDARTAVASTQLAKSPAKGIEKLRQCYTDSEAFLETLHDRFAGILSGARAAITASKTTVKLPRLP
jgi:hypothetical protein